MTLCRPLFWLATLGLLAGWGGDARADDPHRAAVEKLVAPLIKDRSGQGVVVGIVTPAGDHVYGFGTVKLAGGEQTPDANTLFEIGSITKVFTGILLADRVKAGVVRLDDPAQLHLPEAIRLPRRDERDITLLHLATHTSGLPRMPPGFAIAALLGPEKDGDNPYKHFRPAHLGATLSLIHLDRAIGSRVEYSNLGSGLLGRALAHASKAEGYEPLLVERVLRPLGLDDTRITLSDSQRRRLAPGFDEEGKPAPHWDFGCLEGCGALHSSAADLMKFMKANLGGGPGALKDALALARQEWREMRPGESAIGLGWHIAKPRGRGPVRWHNGETGGFHAYLGIVPLRQVGVVVLYNRADAEVDSVGVGTLKHLDPGSKPRP